MSRYITVSRDISLNQIFDLEIYQWDIKMIQWISMISNNGIATQSARLGFNDLPDELMSLIMNYSLHVFDRRSRTVVQKKVDELLIIPERSPIVIRRLMEKVIWLPTCHQQYYTLRHELRQSISPEQLNEIAKAPLSDRIRLMGEQAQQNHDHALAEIAWETVTIPIGDLEDPDETQIANWFRDQLQSTNIT